MELKAPGPRSRFRSRARFLPQAPLEVASLANWLALRAVDQQTKKIDALESAREIPTTTATIFRRPKG